MSSVPVVLIACSMCLAQGSRKVFTKEMVKDGTANAAASGWTTGTYTTGYWDCCKPSCSWGGKGNVNRPIPSCDLNGQELSDNNVQSVCQGGSATSCDHHQPFLVHSRLAMGFAAAAVGGASGFKGDENC